MKDKTIEKVIFTVGASGAALMLILSTSRHSYDYYTIMRWLVLLVCVLGVYIGAKLNLKYEIWILSVTGLIVNPIISFHFRKVTWNIIDPILAIVLILSIILIWKEEPFIK
jgi:hypothetical protein